MTIKKGTKVVVFYVFVFLTNDFGDIL